MKVIKKATTIRAVRFMPASSGPMAILRAMHEQLPGMEGAVVVGTYDNSIFTVATLEGEYIVSPGDWIVTGSQGERWPVSDERFRQLYSPTDEPGVYAQAAQERDAIRMPNRFTIHCSGGDLEGQAGDWLVLATPDDAYPVAAAVFDATYEVQR